MIVSLWLFIVLLASIASSYDPSISNGTCYYGANKQAAAGYIPCGNAAGGVQSCCQARDICLSSNACFNGQFTVTYLAGCTDEKYSDRACPFKGQYADQQWVGLVRCGASSGAGEEWGPCEEPIQPKVNKGNTLCGCDASQNTAVFTDHATLTNIASLPVSISNAIAWFPGFTPSTTITSSTSTRSSSGSTTVATVTTTLPSTKSGATPDSTTATSPAASDSVSSPLSTGAKAGIGIGSVAFVFCIVGLFFLVSWHRRRKSKAVLPVEDQIRPSSLGPWGAANDNLSDPPMSAVGAHMSWGGKSELPTEANEVSMDKTSLGGNTIRTSLPASATMYHPYQHSPTAEASEIDGSPAASTSRLAPAKPAYVKPAYGGQVYEMPG